MTRWGSALFEWWCQFVCWAVALGTCMWAGWMLFRLDPAAFPLTILGCLMVLLLVRHQAWR